MAKRVENAWRRIRAPFGERSAEFWIATLAGIVGGIVSGLVSGLLVGVVVARYQAAMFRTDVSYSVAPGKVDTDWTVRISNAGNMSSSFNLLELTFGAPISFHKLRPDMTQGDGTRIASDQDLAGMDHVYLSLPSLPARTTYTIMFRLQERGSGAPSVKLVTSDGIVRQNP